MNIIQLARFTEDEARNYLESLRWPDGTVCPHCECRNVTKMEGEKHRTGAYQCNNSDCRQQFAVTVGTVLESSKVSLVNWLMAFHLICSSKKGFSALQLQRELHLGSYKTAWFMNHRIRYAMATGEGIEPLKNIVEVDEVYIGGKPRHGGPPSKRGRGTEKTPVAVFVERDGNVHCRPVERVDAATLKGEIHKFVDSKAAIMTDEWRSYAGIGIEFEGGHRVVCYKNKEYARTDADGVHVHNNTAESFNALIKRGHYGVYHQMSKKHLHRYCAEFGFRWDHRKVSDHERMEAAIMGISGKRLLYETPQTTA